MDGKVIWFSSDVLPVAQHRLSQLLNLHQPARFAILPRSWEKPRMLARPIDPTRPRQRFPLRRIEPSIRDQPKSSIVVDEQARGADPTESASQRWRPPSQPSERLSARIQVVVGKRVVGKFQLSPTFASSPDEMIVSEIFTTLNHPAKYPFIPRRIGRLGRH